MSLEAVHTHLQKSTLPMSLPMARGMSPTTPRTLLLGQHLRLRRYRTQPPPRQAAAALARLVVVRAVAILLADLTAPLETRLETAVQAMAVVLLAARALLVVTP
jgi:hypothetical protein